MTIETSALAQSRDTAAGEDRTEALEHRDDVLQRLMTIEEVSGYLGVPVKTIYRWRTNHTAPSAMMVGKHLKFGDRDLAAWLDSRRSVRGPPDAAGSRPAAAAPLLSTRPSTATERAYACDAWTEATPRSAVRGAHASLRRTQS